MIYIDQLILAHPDHTRIAITPYKRCKAHRRRCRSCDARDRSRGTLAEQWGALTTRGISHGSGIRDYIARGIGQQSRHCYGILRGKTPAQISIAAPQCKRSGFPAFLKVGHVFLSQHGWQCFVSGGIVLYVGPEDGKKAAETP
jgi:hypothetical protein